jgi:hypothetical protein
MSDLRVTDVQAALRHFAGVGHDVLTDPHAVHLDGQRYGLAVGHHLQMFPGEELNTRHLNSYLMQAERPIISQITTSSSDSYGGFERHNRDTEVYKPHRYMDDLSEIIGHHDNFRDADLPDGEDDIGYAHQSTEAPKGVQPLWTPDTSTIPGRTIHDALKSHTNPDVTHTGYFYDANSHRREMTPREMSNFDMRGALGHLVRPSEPFKGLITVSSNPLNSSGTRSYIYNPDTEQLFRHES